MSVLAQVPRGVLRKIEASGALRDALTAAHHASAYGRVIAFASIESTLVAARRQQRRIARAKASVSKPERSRRGMGALFDDVHFYLICWNRIAKLARFISRATKFRRTGLVLRRYYADLQVMIDARDHLEHFEERLPGGLKHHTLAVPGDLFNLSDQCATFGGRRVDVGPDSLLLLATIVEEFQASVLFDAVESLASSDPRRLSFLIQRAATRVGIERETRRVTKLIRQRAV